MSNIKKFNEYLASLPDEHQKVIRDYNKIKTRYIRNGENIANKRGRKSVSLSHKKQTKKDYYERKKQEKILAGYVPKPRGRPKKLDP